MQVIGEDCSFQEWRFLANIVDQLRTAGVLALPPLMGLDECGATEGSGDCFNLEQGMKHPLIWSPFGTSQLQSVHPDF